jgi:hypothetical protein
VRLERLDLTQRHVASAVHELQRRAYRIEAELIGSTKIPPLRETLEELQALREVLARTLSARVYPGACQVGQRSGIRSSRPR